MTEEQHFYPYYVEAWRQILVGWLEWTDARFNRWISEWEADLNAGKRGGWDWMYHEDELYYVLGYLVPHDLAKQLRIRHTQPSCLNDLQYLEFDELHKAIRGHPIYPSWGEPEYDWSAAKARVEEVLSQYGVSLNSLIEENEKCMQDFILLMHNDAPESPGVDTDAAWDPYFKALIHSGRFLGGSAMGTGRCFKKSGPAKEITAHVIGYIHVQAESIDDAKKFLEGNPVFDTGGTVEIRELPRS